MIEKLWAGEERGVHVLDHGSRAYGRAGGDCMALAVQDGVWRDLREAGCDALAQSVAILDHCVEVGQLLEVLR